MAFSELAFMENMTSEQRMLFQSQYNGAKKSPTTGVLLALLLGGIGGHRFYMGQVGLGVLYLVFVWTFIPSCVAFIEMFLMPGRVDRYNESTAMELAAKVRMLGPATPALT